ncbi:hypothetical protein DPMN_106066 [Dreissena polymorpha]|uniref:Uncharacterized protein n=1 Tax=Dreissena polymorpha TaxID=45954 RepID=A0A9D4QID8_DREPO|nr:hypothetical protein DPMN_106066 [Dreissena polymorpha]
MSGWSVHPGDVQHQQGKELEIMSGFKSLSGIVPGASNCERVLANMYVKVDIDNFSPTID